MTKQELIDHLQHLEQYTHYSEDAPALREAIALLSQSYSTERAQKRTETHACDLIKEFIVKEATNPMATKQETIGELIRCKDCRKHNVFSGYKNDCCPLYEWRGVSYGHEHDYQYCSFAKRRTDAETEV